MLKKFEFEYDANGNVIVCPVISVTKPLSIPVKPTSQAPVNALKQVSFKIVLISSFFNLIRECINSVFYKKNVDAKLFNEFIVEEHRGLLHAKAEVFPPRERSILGKMWERWNNLDNKWKWAISASLSIGISLGAGTATVTGTAGLSGGSGRT
mgnify:CR=1 FL=1